MWSTSCKHLNERLISTTYKLECALRHDMFDAFRAMVRNDSTLLEHSRCLSIAVEKGHLDVIDEIVEAGGDVHAPDFSGQFPLLVAADFGNIVVMKKLLQHGAHPDLGAIDVSSYSRSTKRVITSTPLLQAISSWDGCTKLEAMKLLLSWGADVNQVDEFGYSPLALAIEKNKKEVVKFLLKSGADVTMLSPSRKFMWEIAPTTELDQILRENFTEHGARRLKNGQPKAQAKKVPKQYTMPAPLLPTTEETLFMQLTGHAVPTSKPPSAAAVPVTGRPPGKNCKLRTGSSAHAEPGEKGRKPVDEDTDCDYSDDPDDCSATFHDDCSASSLDDEQDERNEPDVSSVLSSSAEGRGDTAATGADRALDRQLLRELLGTVQEQRAVIAALKKQLRARK